MPVYTASPSRMEALAPMRPASVPKRKAKGIPTNCTSRIAVISSACPIPISVPKAVAILMMVWMPSL